MCTFYAHNLAWCNTQVVDQYNKTILVMKQKALKNLQMLTFVMKTYRRHMPDTYREIVQNKLRAKIMYDSKSDKSIFMGLTRY